jgi:hypothetical protein
LVFLIDFGEKIFFSFIFLFSFLFMVNDFGSFLIDLLIDSSFFFFFYFFCCFVCSW